MQALHRDLNLHADPETRPLFWLTRAPLTGRDLSLEAVWISRGGHGSYQLKASCGAGVMWDRTWGVTVFVFSFQPKTNTLYFFVLGDGI